jgi:hypothetical protein
MHVHKATAAQWQGAATLFTLRRSTNVSAAAQQKQATAHKIDMSDDRHMSIHQLFVIMYKYVCMYSSKR